MCNSCKNDLLYNKRRTSEPDFLVFLFHGTKKNFLWFVISSLIWLTGGVTKLLDAWPCHLDWMMHLSIFIFIFFVLKTFLFSSLFFIDCHLVWWVVRVYSPPPSSFPFPVLLIFLFLWIDDLENPTTTYVWIRPKWPIRFESKEKGTKEKTIPIHINPYKSCTTLALYVTGCVLLLYWEVELREIAAGKRHRRWLCGGHYGVVGVSM